MAGMAGLFYQDALSGKLFHSPYCHRLDFRRLPGPVFDPPRRETAGRVTR